MMSEVRQLAGATFRPDLSPSRQREGECFLVGCGAAWQASIACGCVRQHTRWGTPALFLHPFTTGPLASPWCQAGGSGVAQQMAQ